MAHGRTLSTTTLQPVNRKVPSVTNALEGSPGEAEMADQILGYLDFFYNAHNSSTRANDENSDGNGDGDGDGDGDCDGDVMVMASPNSRESATVGRLPDTTPREAPVPEGEGGGRTDHIPSSTSLEMSLRQRDIPRASGHPDPIQEGDILRATECSCLTTSLHS
jgi:hypothetical protein